MSCPGSSTDDLSRTVDYSRDCVSGDGDGHFQILCRTSNDSFVFPPVTLVPPLTKVFEKELLIGQST